MPTRTYKFRGGAFAPTGSVTVVAVFNGIEVHNGTIPTIASEPPSANDEMIDLWQADMDAAMTGNVNLSIQVQGGTLFFGGLLANSPYNPPTEFGVPYVISEESDGKNMVMIDGVPEYSRIPTPDPNTDGEWQYPIESGETFTCVIALDTLLVDI